MEKNKYRVLVVDDTKFMRQALQKIFTEDPEIEVVGTAKDGKVALNAILETKPDVVTMDIDMPTMDGLTALKHIMMKSPVPIVMVSAMADNPEINFESWRLGSIEFVRKPSGSVSEDIESQKEELLKKVKEAARANLKSIKRVRLKNKLTLKSIKQELTTQNINVLIGGAGSLNTVIGIIRSYSPQNNCTLIAFLDFNKTTLVAFHKRLNEISKMDILLATESIFVPGRCCILVSKEDPVQLIFKNNTFNLEISDIEKYNVNMFLSNLPDVIYQHGSLYVLSSYEKNNLKGLRTWIKRGGSIYFQDPDTCMFPQLINEALEKNITGEIVSVLKMSEILSKA